MLPKGVGVAKFDFNKTFRNQLFSHVRVLYHQSSITNHNESILKSKIMSILMIILLLFFLSDLLRNILKCNCSPYSTLTFNPDDNVFTWCNIMQQCTITSHPCIKYTWGGLDLAIFRVLGVCQNSHLNK